LTLYTVGFDDLVTSFVSTIATGWSDPLPGGTASHWETAPIRGALCCRAYTNPLTDCALAHADHPASFAAIKTHASM
jgi:hypothetical protein